MLDSVGQGNRDRVSIDTRQWRLTAGDGAVDSEVLQHAATSAGLGIGTNGRAPDIAVDSIAIQAVRQGAAKGARHLTCTGGGAGASAIVQTDVVRGAVSAQHGDVAGLIDLCAAVVTEGDGRTLHGAGSQDGGGDDQ